MKTWTLQENYEWIKTLPGEQQNNVWRRIAEAQASKVPDSVVNDTISEVRRRGIPTPPTLTDMLRGAWKLLNRC
jgi:hypothetical protein